MEGTIEKKYAELEDRKLLEEELRRRDAELGRELNELEHEVPVQ